LKFNIASRVATPVQGPSVPFCCDGTLIEDEHIPQTIDFLRLNRGGNLGDKSEPATIGSVYADSVNDLRSIQGNTLLF